MTACEAVANTSAEASHQRIGVGWTGDVNRVPVYAIRVINSGDRTD